MSAWFYAQEGVIIYLVLALGLIGGGLGLPIPEDLPLLGAGIAVHEGAAGALPAFLVCYFSILVGDFAIFYIGRRLGPAIFKRRWFKSRFSASGIRRVKVNLERRSLLMIFVARHLFYLRTLTFLTCGAVHMHPRRFLVADAAAAVVSVPLMMSLGYAAAEHYTTIINAIRHAEVASVGLLLVGMGWLYLRLRRRRKAPVAE